MKLKQLKQEAIELWKILNEVDGTALALDQFRQDIRQYGKLNGKADLRCRATWERTCIAMEAASMLKSLENTDLVLYLTSRTRPLAFLIVMRFYGDKEMIAGVLEGTPHRFVWWNAGSLKSFRRAWFAL